jgi:hypothetical protein
MREERLRRDDRIDSAEGASARRSREIRQEAK